MTVHGPSLGDFSGEIRRQPHQPEPRNSVCRRSNAGRELERIQPAEVDADHLAHLDEHVKYIEEFAKFCMVSGVAISRPRHVLQKQ